MDKKLAEEITLGLLQEHGLTELGWKYKLNRRESSAGVCNYRTQYIQLSKSYVELNDESHIRDTILHEIAHALVGRSHGHDDVWRQKAISIGCTGKVRIEIGETIRARGKYEAICSYCKNVFPRQRLPRNMTSCSKCDTGFSFKYYLEFKLVTNK